MANIVSDPQGLTATLESLSADSNNSSGIIDPQITERSDTVSVTGPQTRYFPSGDSRLVKESWLRPTENQVRNLRKDPTISLVREIIISPAISTPWTVEEREGAPDGAKEEIKEEFFHHRLTLLQDSFLGCIDYGWSPFEIVWGLNRKGKVVPIWFKQLLHEWTWILINIDDGKFWGFSNEPAGGRNSIVGEGKALNFNLEVEGTDWYGVSSLGKTKSIQDKWDSVDKSATRFDQKIAGAHWIVYFPVGKTPFSLDPEVAAVDTNNDVIAKRILTTLEANGSTAIPDEVQEWMDDDVDKNTKGKWRIELLSAGSNVNAQFTDRLKYLDNLKVRAMGIPERAVLEGKFGTKAEADTHAEAGIANIDRKHRMIVQEINKGPVNTFLRVNYGEEAENTVSIQVSPLIDARFSILKESFSRILQDGEGLRGLSELIDARAISEELGVPLQPGEKQLKIEKVIPSPSNSPKEDDDDGDDERFKRKN